MRNMKLRLISAALATCMMASVLPASAFAIEPADATTGTVANGQTEITTQLHGGETIDTAGNYTMSGKYTAGITVNTDQDVKITITGPVTIEGGKLFNVSNVRELTVENTGNIVEATTLDAEELFYIENGTVTVNGGIYKNSQETDKAQAKTLFYLAGKKDGTVAPTLNLNDVTAEANGKSVLSDYGTVTITGGTYTTAYPDNATVRNNFGTLTLNNPTIIGVVGNPVGTYGTTTINGGNYISQSASMALNAGDSGQNKSAKTYVHGGVFEGTGTVVCNRAYMEIDGDPVIRVTGEQGTAKRVGVRTDYGGTTIIKNATIENAEYGVWNRWADNDKQDTSVTVGDVTFENTEKNIRLEEGKTVTINDSLTGTVTIDWDGEDAASIITNGSTFSEDLKLISANEDYVMTPDESGVFSAQKRAEDNYLVDTENATATADLGNGTQTLYYYTQVPEGTKVTLTAAEDPVGQHFDHWELLQDDEDKTAELLGEFSEEDRKEKTVSFAMPKYDLTAKAVFASDSVPAADTEDDSWDAATVITGVAIGAGAAVLTYHIGTELYAEQVLGKGVAVPKTREDVALKAWELAGKPAAELNGEPLSEAAQAEKWAVESGLMQNVDGSFNGAKKMSKLKALRVLDSAKKMNAQ